MNQDSITSEFLERVAEMRTKTSKALSCKVASLSLAGNMNDGAQESLKVSLPTNKRALIPVFIEYATLEAVHL